MACMQRREAINANWIESEWVAISRQDPKPSCLIKVFLQHHLCWCFSSVRGKVKKCQSMQENVITSKLHWPQLSSLPSTTKMKLNRITKTICNLRKKFRSSSLTKREKKLEKEWNLVSHNQGHIPAALFDRYSVRRGRVIATLCTPCDYFLTPLFPRIKYNSVTKKKSKCAPCY